MLHHRRVAGYVTGVPAALALAFTITGCDPAGSEPRNASPAKASVKASATPSSNGMDGLKPAEIIARARAATAAARYVRLRGQAEDGGEKYAFDFRFAGRTMATGWIRQGSERIDLTRVGKTVYIAGNTAFWKSVGGKGAVQIFSGKHIKTKSTDPDFKEIADFADRTTILAEALKGQGGWRKEKPGTLGAVPTVVLSDSAGDRLQVAARGRPYILRLTGGRDDRLEYLGYEQPVTVQPPPAGSVIDPSALE